MSAARFIPGADLLQHFQHLADDRVFQDRETGETTSWLCKAGDQAGFDRIPNPDEYHRNGASLLMKDRSRPMAPDHDHIGLEVQELHSAAPHAVHIVGGPSLVELHVAACGPAESCQLFPLAAARGVPDEATRKRNHGQLPLASKMKTA